MELKDLVGKHILDAVDESTESVKNTWGDGYEDCNVMRFRLDGVVYVVIEDPDDGYRSSMREVRVDENAQMNNLFDGIEVLGVYRDKGKHSGESDILELLTISNGRKILEVGTEDTDDYYPCFVASFTPPDAPVEQEQEQKMAECVICNARLNEDTEYRLLHPGKDYCGISTCSLEHMVEAIEREIKES